MKTRPILSALGLAIALIAAVPQSASAQRKFTIKEVLEPGFNYELVAARKVDRIAWLANIEGRRNVYTAAAPEFAPVRLTNFMDDDGVDLTSLRLSDDGAVAVFVRGHTPNRDGWVANPSSDPRGGERAIWAVRTDGGEPWKLAVAASPALSPNGKWVLFTRDGQIYGVPVDRNLAEEARRRSEAPLFRAYGTNGGPVWSPDGSRIAYVSNRGDHSYIAVYNIDNPGVSYMAPGVDRDTSPTWSPDGKRIAFIRRPGATFSEIAGGGGAGGGRGGRRGAPPSAEGGQRRGGGRGGPDGLRRVAFADGSTLQLWTADVETGEGKPFWSNPVGGERVFANIRSIDWAGESVIFELNRNNWRHQYAIPIAGGVENPIELTPGEGLTEFIGLSPDGRALFYSTNVGDIDRRHLWRVSTSGGEPVQLTSGDGIETYPAPMASGRWVAAMSAGVKQPQSVALVPAEGGRPAVIFPRLPAGAPQESFVTPESVVLEAPDGLKFHNQLFVPADIRPGERRPAILFTHGGPARQMLLGYQYLYFYHMAYAIDQYFCNQGYVVISVNYRSGIGYGDDFQNAADRGQRGNSEYQDVRTAGEYLASRPDVDPARIGLWGLSYGGILTAQGLARDSDLFAAGVDIAGVHLWGNSIDPEATAYRSSSVSEIENWKSPVLLIHGDDDRNVAFSQTVGLVQLLRAHGIYHELIVFPDDVHDFLVHEKWLKSFAAADDFFDRFLRRK
jgi:dipeptidyl aminopeptidase/acylaminoacyl peptidase